VQAVNCLAEIGPAAAAAVPMLRGFLPSPGTAERRPSPLLDLALDYNMINACTRALTRITPSPD